MNKKSLLSLISIPALSTFFGCDAATGSSIDANADEMNPESLAKKQSKILVKTQGASEIFDKKEISIFARFPDLNDSKTIEKLYELENPIVIPKEKKAEAIAEQEKAAAAAEEKEVVVIEKITTYPTLIKLLASGASSIELEKVVLPLIAKQKAEEANVTLAAIMRGYYISNLREEFLAGEVNRNEVFKDLIKTDENLTTAAFGVSPKTARNINRSKLIRR